MSCDREVLASAQMRDRIADYLDQQAARRDHRHPAEVESGAPAAPKVRLLRGIARNVRDFSPQPAEGRP